MNEQLNLPEIKAEVLLNYLHPQLAERWLVKHAGTFYRNYSRDLLSVDNHRPHVTLSRDGFLKRIPQGLLAGEDALKGAQFHKKHKQLKEQMQLLQTFFLPVDSFFFRKTIHLETQVSELLHDKLSYILKQFFRVDYEHERNPYLKSIYPLLLYVNEVKANFNFLRDILTQLTGYPVEMTTGRYTESDRTTCSLPYVKISVVVPHLSNEAYVALHSDLAPLFRFLDEWFVPFDLKCNFAIRHPQQPFQPGADCTLGYNTELAHKAVKY